MVVGVEEMSGVGVVMVGDLELHAVADTRAELPELGVVVGVEEMSGVGVVMVGDHELHAVANTRADCVQVVGLHW